MTEPTELARCATCRHWQKIDLDDSWPEVRLRDDGGSAVYADDDFTPAVPPGQWGFCMKVAEFGPTKADRFYVVDGSEYMAKMGTREDFGCVEHEHQEAGGSNGTS